MAGSEVDALTATLRALWPDSEAVEQVRESGRPDGRGDTFVLLPSARAPRLLVPAGHPAAAANALRRFSTALEPREVLSRLLAAGVVRAGGTHLMRDRIKIRGGAATSIRRHLSEVLGTEVQVSLGIGTARANRKPVLQVFDMRGRTLAFAKVADTQYVEQHVRSETDALGMLASRTLPRSIEVPRVLHAGTWRGLRVLVLSALDGAALQRPGQWVVPHVAMRELSEAFGEGRRRLTDAAWWSDIRETQERLVHVERRERYARALDRLAELAADETFPIGAWHGDWTPWNMCRRRHRVQLWDWERFETGVPTGLDSRHYMVNAVTRRGGLSLTSVREGLALANGSTDDPRARLLDATYLAAICARYLSSAQEERAEFIEPRALVMLEALEENVRVR